MRTFWQIGIAVLVVGICIAACNTRSGVSSNNFNSIPEPTSKNISSEPVNSPVQTSAPTMAVTPSIPLTISENNKSVSDFPLTLGNTWVYSSTRYEGHKGPGLMTATYIITKRVIKTQASPPYTVARMGREEKLLTASAQWGGGEWEHDYWRIISGTHIYRQEFNLNLSDQETFQLEYLFPLSTTKSWCPAESIPEKDCIALGKRTVIKSLPRTVPAGDFETCYEIIEDFNTGTYSQWFCPGIGIVEEKSDHGGFPFGFRNVLIDVIFQSPESNPSQPYSPEQLTIDNPLTEFPLTIGTTWVYSYTPYDPLPSDPTQTMTATYIMTETVINLRSMPPYWAAQVERVQEVISQPAGWGQVISNQPERFWYVISGTLIFEQWEEPNSMNFPDFSSLAYNLPLRVDKQWCPIRLDLSNWDNPREIYCEANGMRTVVDQMAYETPAGTFDNCYEITEAFTSGGVTRWFCEGIGVVAASYDHGGTRFGFRQVLIDYSVGEP